MPESFDEHTTQASCLQQPCIAQTQLCDVAVYAREGREDDNRVDLEPTMLIDHGDGRFGLELKMWMVKFKKTANFSYDDRE